MKIQAARVISYIKNPDPNIRIFVLYGPDQGMIREYGKTLAKQVLPDLSDPFCFVELTKAILSEDPSRLSDEAAAMSLTGGQRVICVRDAGDWLTTYLTNYLENPVGDARIIIEADNLATSSSLRKLADKDNAIASLACYAAEGKSLTAFIATTLRENGYSIDQDALFNLADQLGADQLITKSELDKLQLYVGERKNITATDVAQAIGDSSSANAEAAIIAAGAGDLKKLYQCLDRLQQDDVNAIVVLRAGLRHFERLLTIRLNMDAGQTLNQAVDSFRPPIFFKVKPQVTAQAKRWSIPAVMNVLKKLQDIEAQCKQTGQPADLLAGQTLLEIAAKSRGLKTHYSVAA